MKMTNDIPQPKRARNIWKIVLTISLVLNIAVLGAIGGAALRLGNAHLKGREIGSVYIRALSRDQRRQLGRQMGEQEGYHKAKRKNIDASYQEAIRILRSDNFDQGVFEAIVKGPMVRASERLKNAQSIFLGHIMYMSFDERVAYADRIEGALKRRSQSKR
jgi:hypothetical protein